MKLFHRAMLGLILVTVVLFTRWPGLDLEISRLFYAPGLGFFWRDQALIELVYEATKYLSALLLLALALGFAATWVWRSLRARRAMLGFLLASLLLGPGVLVNLVLKEESGRARPDDIVEFGGRHAFTAVLAPAEQCAHNCSFVSGHAAMGFFLLSFAWVSAPLPRRGWIALGLATGALIGLVRVVQGGHFVSDVLFALFAVYAVNVLLSLLLRPRASRPMPAGP
jgi:lipid A 4'-phosphatase